MPVFLLERIPFPSLRTYTTGSVLFFSCALLYACRENKFGMFNSAADYARSSPLELPDTEDGDSGTKKFESGELNDPNEDGFHRWLLELFGFKVCGLLENVWLLGVRCFLHSLCVCMVVCMKVFFETYFFLSFFSKSYEETFTYFIYVSIITSCMDVITSVMSIET